MVVVVGFSLCSLLPHHGLLCAARQNCFIFISSVHCFMAHWNWQPKSLDDGNKCHFHSQLTDAWIGWLFLHSFWWKVWLKIDILWYNRQKTNKTAAEKNENSRRLHSMSLTQIYVNCKRQAYKMKTVLSLSPIVWKKWSFVHDGRDLILCAIHFANFPYDDVFDKKRTN